MVVRHKLSRSPTSWMVRNLSDRVFVPALTGESGDPGTCGAMFTVPLFPDMAGSVEEESPSSVPVWEQHAISM
jgi:hypothetical protein